LNTTFTPDDTVNYSTTSRSVELTVQQTSTTTTLTSSSNPQRINQPLTLTATVTANGTATGSVVFKSGVTVLGTATVSGNQATLTLSFVTTTTITAYYSGDANNLISTSAPLTEQIVPRFATTTTMSSSSSSSLYGQFVTLSAFVNAPTAPLGVVLFRNGTAILGAGTVDTTGAAFLTKNLLPVGTLSLSAQYVGSATLAPSTGTFTQTVAQAPSTVTLMSVVNPSNAGQAVDIVATLNTTLGTAPTGTVTFSSGGTTLGTVTLTTLSAGRAVLTISTLPAGADTVTATYSGNTNVASSSATLAQAVN
jgi:hypothetical protein